MATLIDNLDLNQKPVESIFASVLWYIQILNLLILY